MPPIAYRCDVLAPWGASDTTAQLLRTTVRAPWASQPNTLGNILGSLLVQPFFGTELPFGIAVLGWCHDPRHLDSTVWPMVLRAQYVNALCGETVATEGWAGTCPDGTRYGILHGYPLSDLCEDDARTAAYQQVSPVENREPRTLSTIAVCHQQLIAESAKYDPVVIFVSVAADSEPLAEQKLDETKTAILSAVESE